VFKSIKLSITSVAVIFFNIFVVYFMATWKIQIKSFYVKIKALFFLHNYIFYGKIPIYI
jgi:hypothetical protein